MLRFASIWLLWINKIFDNFDGVFIEKYSMVWEKRKEFLVIFNVWYIYPSWVGSYPCMGFLRDDEHFPTWDSTIRACYIFTRRRLSVLLFFTSFQTPFRTWRKLTHTRSLAAGMRGRRSSILSCELKQGSNSRIAVCCWNDNNKLPSNKQRYRKLSELHPESNFCFSSA